MTKIFVVLKDLFYFRLSSLSGLLEPIFVVKSPTNFLFPSFFTQNAEGNQRNQGKSSKYLIKTQLYLLFSQFCLFKSHFYVILYIRSEVWVKFWFFFVIFQDFLLKARRKDAKSVKIKKNADNTKFKVRISSNYWSSEVLLWFLMIFKSSMSTYWIGENLEYFI